ncbi:MULTISPECIES: hypothetical protein [Bacillus]|uniref:hypothetical protein n=1 Tax=Bacillus TaxID=1386 RepID=UPI00273D61A7|nr:hypothetical protein [Bacillus sp. MMSF_3328]
MKRQVKRDHLFFACYVEGLLEELEKGWIDEKRFAEVIKSKHEELKNENFSRVITLDQ